MGMLGMAYWAFQKGMTDTLAGMGSLPVGLAHRGGSGRNWLVGAGGRLDVAWAACAALVDGPHIGSGK